jgi:formamidopyrimidine-DNA glycosylase
MPELPEVEYIRRGLDAHLPGRQIESVVVHWAGALATHSPEDFVPRVTGLRFGPVSRRGKFLILRLDPVYLLVHLRMTGRLYLSDAPSSEWEGHPHVRVTFCLDDGGRLYFRDMRKFGRIYLTGDPARLLEKLGPEPLGNLLSMEAFRALLTSRRRQIKPLLLDQSFIAGMGNIYVDESLWLARLHPLRRSDSLDAAEAAALYEALRHILREAIAHGGTTTRDYRGANDEIGSHQHALAVYRRTGLPCPRCDTPIVRTVVGQRGTHYCPVCQVAPQAEERNDERSPAV